MYTFITKYAAEYAKLIKVKRGIDGTKILRTSLWIIAKVILEIELSA